VLSAGAIPQKSSAADVVRAVGAGVGAGVGARGAYFSESAEGEKTDRAPWAKLPKRQESSILSIVDGDMGFHVRRQATARSEGSMLETSAVYVSILVLEREGGGVYFGARTLSRRRSWRWRGDRCLRPCRDLYCCIVRSAGGWRGYQWLTGDVCEGAFDSDIFEALFPAFGGGVGSPEGGDCAG
jgi:hypothetical protein